MQYKTFKIENFKGIESAEISLTSAKARVISLVGLNESGKTTVLEAIRSFAPDMAADTVVGRTGTSTSTNAQVIPRSKISNFTGDVAITATVKLEDGDKDKIGEGLLEYDLHINLAEVPDEFEYRRYSRYDNGSLVGNFFSLSFKPSVKGIKARRFRPANGTQQGNVGAVLRGLMPTIAYFPTFVFDFPDRIYLSGRPADKRNGFYRRLFQDILDFGGKGFTIQDQITNRVRSDEFLLEWSGFFPVFRKSTEWDQIDHTVKTAARTVSQVVYSKWNEIFHEETDSKEIEISWDADEGLQTKAQSEAGEKPLEHDIFVQFRVKDGAETYNIETRSLGFRWFFSFLLFTQFRAGRNNRQPVVFLLDEPASNLHASAQQKLIESFPEIAKAPHRLIYSTHSHYLIHPHWLEQTYVVQNDPAHASGKLIDEAVLDDARVKVEVTPYRQFVEKSPNRTSYFQPIVDRLSVVPSRFDLDVSGIILEGKSDYYILQYFNQQYNSDSLRLYPGLGAGTLSALVAILRGWGKAIRIVLDSDEAGEKEKGRYSINFNLSESEIALLGDFSENTSKIENIFSEDDLRKLGIAKKKPSQAKKELLLTFQENLAAGTRLPLTSQTISRAKGLLAKLEGFAK